MPSVRVTGPADPGRPAGIAGRGVPRGPRRRGSDGITDDFSPDPEHGQLWGNEAVVPGCLRSEDRRRSATASGAPCSPSARCGESRSRPRPRRAPPARYRSRMLYRPAAGLVIYDSPVPGCRMLRCGSTTIRRRLSWTCYGRAEWVRAPSHQRYRSPLRLHRSRPQVNADAAEGSLSCLVAVACCCKLLGAVSHRPGHVTPTITTATVAGRRDRL